jgi:hypothetical protein
LRARGNARVVLAREAREKAGVLFHGPSQRGAKARLALRLGHARALDCGKRRASLRLLRLDFSGYRAVGGHGPYADKYCTPMGVRKGLGWRCRLEQPTPTRSGLVANPRHARIA